MEQVEQMDREQQGESEVEEYELSENVIEQICAVTSRVACQQFYELYQKAEDDRVKSHRRTVAKELEKYRLYKRMLDTDMRLTPAEMIEYRFDFIRDLMGDSLRNYEADYSMKKEIDRKKRVQYC